MASNMSDFIIETTTEAYESLVSVKNCDKNPEHVGFYSVNNLTVDILPVGCRTEKWLNYIRAWSKRIVRLIINKPDGTRLFGSGCVYMDDDDSDKFYIKTNEHVIGSQQDVRNCTIEFFYNTEDRAGIETSHGVELIECYKELDVCMFTVYSIPETVKLLLQPIDTPPNTDLENIIVISHPHGAPKTITIGKYLGAELVYGLGYRSIHTARTCPGSSGAAIVNTKRVNNISMFDWRYGLYYTHYAGQRGDVYNIKRLDGTVIKEVISKTNNINYCV